jgi:hypothetical protein
MKAKWTWAAATYANGFGLNQVHSKDRILVSFR